MTYNEFIQDIINTRGQYGIPLDQYCEVHHIIPKCKGGEPVYSSRDIKHENLIWLYPEEHYIAHKLLALENSDNINLIRAFILMSRIYNPELKDFIKITDQEYGVLRKKYSNLLTGHKVSEETKLKQKIARNRYLSEHPETIEEIRREVNSRNKDWNLKLSKSHNGYKIVCIETGKVYNYLCEAANELNISKGNIWSCLQGRRKTAGGYHWDYFDSGR